MPRTYSLSRYILPALLLLFFLSGLILLRKFYVQNTILVPAEGGTYIEGSVEQLQPLMPWFTVKNDVNRDIVSLVFSGLQKYNPSTGKIEDDLATLTVSDNKKIFTIELLENLYWHDSTLESPHPVTADDVIYTFTTIQDEDFSNSLLRQNFLGVEIDKLSDRKVRFSLVEPYRFFASNLTIGLLPDGAFEGVPISKLDQALDFGFNPIGAGPYKFKGMVQTELSTEVTLERFPRMFGDEFHLERAIFRIFPDYTTLLSDIRNLDGVRLVPRNDQGDPIIPKNFTAAQYTLPQYVALFFNVNNPVLQDLKLRLGLQLGTNKQAIVDSINEKIIIDTPLLEIDTSDWRYQFDSNSAQGALFSSDWHLPQKVRLQRALEQREVNAVGALQVEPIAYLATGAALILTGSTLDTDEGSTLNDVLLEPHPSMTGAWIVALPTNGQTGSILPGENLLKLVDSKGNAIDSAYLWRTTNSKSFKRAAEEQRLLAHFIESRDGSVPFEDRITTADLYIEDGMLRRRLSTDPYDIRVNDKGEKLSLRLLTTENPPQYKEIAELIKKHWEPLGVHIGIDVPKTRSKFEEKLIDRDYDILLFGQSLLDNLDSYAYWHSSNMQQFTDKRSDLRIDAYNLSQYSSLEADSLLELIRKSDTDEELQESLDELDEVLKQDVPAIFLYSPLYTFAYVKNLQGVELGSPSLHSDRFLTLQRWFLKEERTFIANKSWISFIPWLFSLI